MFKAEDTLNRILRDHPVAARVFERHHIDYCCAGGTTLEEACHSRDVETAALITELTALIAPADDNRFAADLPLEGLARHMEEVHHSYLRAEIPRLDLMTNRVAAVHGNRNENLEAVRDVWASLSTLFSEHLDKEERILFPMIRALEDEGAEPDFHCGSVENPILQMKREHREIENGIARLHELTDGYKPPAWACGTYRAMLEALARIESDTLEHTLKEETHLFPRAIAREAERVVQSR